MFISQIYLEVFILNSESESLISVCFSKMLSILIPWEKQFLLLKWWYLTTVCKIVINDKIIPYWLKLVCKLIPNLWDTKMEKRTSKFNQSPGITDISSEKNSKV